MRWEVISCSASAVSICAVRLRLRARRVGLLGTSECKKEAKDMCTGFKDNVTIYFTEEME